MPMPVKKPCIGCNYFNVCGNTNRTVKCKGRELNPRRKRGITL